MSSPTATARAGTSCRRCHRRKKRCDRSLPQCGTCRRAQVICSFIDDDRQLGSYPIAYVQGLEARVRELEKELAAALATSPMTQPFPRENRATIDPDPDVEVPSSVPVLVNFATPPEADLGFNQLPAIPLHSRPGTLVDELKLLSLEATAERHLGSSSGLSFAKLTQAVLRRLSPDKAEFVFDEDPALDPPQGVDSSLAQGAYFDSTTFQDFSNSLLYAPSVFTDICLPQVIENEATLAELRLPEKSHAASLIEFYFAHSHTLYPIIRQNEFTSVLWHIYANPEDSLSHSPLWMFRVWMVLAIGSTTHSSILLEEEYESVIYYNKAMVYFEEALGFGDMAALEVLMLQVSYSFFNQIGPNTWFLVGVAARMAIGMGLHSSSTYQDIQTDVAEYRKRIFFSLYMMDRVVSMALGRPFAMSDDDIDVLPFADVDDENITPDGITPQDHLRPSSVAVPLHILALRQIASEIANKVYSHSRGAYMSPEERENTIQCLHKKLIEWRRNMPFPLPDVNSQVPHLSSSWFDLNYYTHVTMLYRPSPLFPSLDQTKVKVLATAAAMSIRQAINMHRQRRFAYNWLNLLSVFTSSLSLMYATTAQPDNLKTVLNETKSVEDLELAIELLETFGRKFPAATKIRRMVQEVVTRFKSIA